MSHSSKPEIPDDTKIYGFGRRYGKTAETAVVALETLRAKTDGIVLVVGDYPAFTALLGELGATPVELERVRELKIEGEEL